MKNANEFLFGLEVEVEYRLYDYYEDFFDHKFKNFKTTEDGSLRGDASCEYVLSAPKPIGDMEKIVTGLYKDIHRYLEDYDGRIIDSPRAGVHIHYNVKGFDYRFVANFVTLWGIVEEALSFFTGNGRQGSLFALRLADTPFFYNEMCRLLEGGWSFGSTLGVVEGSENFRYSGMNLTKVLSRGSVELRHLRTPLTPEPILTWGSLTSCVYLACGKFLDPKDIIHSFSKLGVDVFMERIFGKEHYRLIKDRVGMNGGGCQAMLYRGVRRIQRFAYATSNWDEASVMKAFNEGQIDELAEEDLE